MVSLSFNGRLNFLETEDEVTLLRNTSYSTAAPLKTNRVTDLPKFSKMQFEAIVNSVRRQDGATVFFNISTKTLENSKSIDVSRSFKDFIWLDYQLRAYYQNEYHIFPPLPSSGGKQSKNNSLVSSKIIDEYSIDCSVLTQYLGVLCRHPKFASSLFLKNFLTQENVDTMKDLTNCLPTIHTFKIPSTFNVQDDYFIKECTFLSTYDVALNNCNAVVRKIVFKTTDLAEIWAANSILMQSSADSSRFNKYLTLFAEVAHDLQYHFIAMRDSDEKSLGVTLSLNCILLNEEKKLLGEWYNSICKCNNLKALLKKQGESRSPKHRQLSDSLIKEESTLATVSEQCKAEIDHYKKERVHTLCYSVAAFAESQLAIAKQIEQSLRVSLMKLKES